MSSPFPGMDPYLEAPEIWRGFHHLLADEIITQLNAVLSPRYYADVEVRTVLEEVGVATTKTVYPDAAVLETGAAMPSSATAVAIPAAPVQRLAMLPEEHKMRTVQVRETTTDTLVTAIEILSPVNKRGGVLAQVYQRAAYARRIDYTLPVPPPPLRSAMQRWVAVHLAPSPEPTDQ